MQSDLKDSEKDNYEIDEELFKNGDFARPEVPLTPVTMAVATKKPWLGDWDWFFSFREERFENGKILPWIPRERPRRVIRVKMHCSYIWDPMEDIYRFIRSLDKWGFRDDPRILVDGEDELFGIMYWSIDPNSLIQVRLSFSSPRDDREPFEFNFLMNRKNMRDQMLKGYSDFTKKYGGLWEDEDLNRTFEYNGEKLPNIIIND